jgi:ketosteroid isomerase-like protein
MAEVEDDPRAAIELLAVRIQRLEDEREISRVLTRYGFAVDIGDADATAALYTDDTEIDLGPGSTFSGVDGARQLVLDERHQAIVGRCAHTMGPFVTDIDVTGDRATAIGYVRVYISDPDMRNPRLWRIGYTRLDLVRSGDSWRIANRLSRSLAADDAAEVLRDGL